MSDNNEIRLSITIHAPAEAIFEAWMDGDKHSAMTGSPATSKPKVGGKFTAWDGYISGEYLEIKPNERIIETWRSTEFADGTPDSRLEVRLRRVKSGTLMTLIHTLLPADQAEEYKKGWKEFYFKPMKKYFNGARP